MKCRNNKLMKAGISSLLIFVNYTCLMAQSEVEKYAPKGDPKKWNLNVTPFLLVPNIAGEVQSKQLSEDFGIGPAEFINTLSGAFMMAAEITKGKFYVSPAYIYTHNEVDKIVYTSSSGKQDLEASLGFKKNIFELKAGGRFRFGEKIILDPFAGFRYTTYNLYGPVVGIKTLAEINEKEDYWDPIFGCQAHIFLHPRVPIEIKADVGGFGVGSELTWSAMLHTGYAVSPAIDLLVGFAILQNQYSQNTTKGNEFGLTSSTYGFDFGIRIYIPARYKDPSLFKS